MIKELADRNGFAPITGVHAEAGHVIGIVDQDPRFVRRMNNIFKGPGGYRTITTLPIGDEVLNLVSADNPDLLILGEPLLGRDTFDVVTRIRAFSSVPIMVLSSLDENHGVGMLEAGADYYLVKGKFGDKELVARAGALLRKVPKDRSPIINPIINNGEFTIDQTQHLVTLRGEEVPLTPIEYRLFVCLARNMGETILQEDIGSEIWGSGLEYYAGSSDGGHMLQVNMARLRAKLGEDSKNPHFIITYPGRGYMMLDLDHEEIEFSIGPMDHKGREDEVYPHSILRSKMDENIFLTEGVRLNVSGRKRQIINIVRSLPDGMAVFKKSMAAALGISSKALGYYISQTRSFLQGSDYTIGNTIPLGNRALWARYYWKK